MPEPWGSRALQPWGCRSLKHCEDRSSIQTGLLGRTIVRQQCHQTDQPVSWAAGQGMSRALASTLYWARLSMPVPGLLETCLYQCTQQDTPFQNLTAK